MINNSLGPVPRVSVSLPAHTVSTRPSWPEEERGDLGALCLYLYLYKICHLLAWKVTK